MSATQPAWHLSLEAQLADRRAVLLDFLSSLQGSPELLPNGNIRFRAVGRDFYLEFDEEDPHFHMVVLPCPRKPSVPPRAAHRAALHANTAIKSAKVDVHEELVLFKTPIWSTNVVSTMQLVRRAISATCDVHNEYYGALEHDADARG